MTTHPQTPHLDAAAQRVCDLMKPLASGGGYLPDNDETRSALADLRAALAPPEREAVAILAEIVACHHAPNPTNPDEWRVKPGKGMEHSRLIAQAIAALAPPSDAAKDR